MHMRATLHLVKPARLGRPKLGLIRERRARRRRAARRGAHPHATHPPARAGGPREIVATALADPAARRVRDAGGPLDRASYGCACGYRFTAEVSTTVACPHCGAAQAW
jgi:hypothetical protein